MKIDEFGQTTLSEQEAFDALYFGKIKSLDQVYLDDKSAIDLYNKSRQYNADSIPPLSTIQMPDISPQQFHNLRQQNWFMPENYCPNLIESLYEQCKTQAQIERVNQELQLFAQHNMLDLLFYLKYLVDTMRQNNIVWGVGRGSSVASYVLYLIGVHKIDSIKYCLDIKEFLK